MRLRLLLVGHLIVLKAIEESLEYESILLLDNFADGLGSERVFVPPDHLDQPFDLLLVLLPDLFVALDLKLQALSLINPIDPLAPGLVVVELLEDVLKLLFGGDHVLFLRVNHQVIVLREERDEGYFLELHAPRQLLQKAEQLVLVDGVPLGQTAHVYDGVQGNVIGLQLLQDLLANDGPVADLVEPGDVQNPEADLLAAHFEGTSIVVVHLGGHFLQAVRHLNRGVAGQQLGGRRLAGP